MTVSVTRSAAALHLYRATAVRLARLRGGGPTRACVDPQTRRNSINNFNLAIVLHKRGDHAGAEAEYRAALASNPQSTGALVNLGLCRAAVGDDAIAVAADRVARMLRPLPPAVLTRLKRRGAAVHIIGSLQVTSDLPELRHLRSERGLYEEEAAIEGRRRAELRRIGRAEDLGPRRVVPHATIDERTRGMGGLEASCGEEEERLRLGGVPRERVDVRRRRRSLARRRRAAERREQRARVRLGRQVEEAERAARAGDGDAAAARARAPLERDRRPRLAERQRAARPPRPAEVDDAQARRRAVRRERAAVRHGDRPGGRSVVARAEELDGTQRRARFLEGGVA